MRLPEERSYIPCPAGNFAAVCIGFIDMGTQETMYGDKRQIRLRWELPTELMGDGRPFTISQTYTWSMSSKSRLRLDLESWRGRPFEKKDFGKEGFETRKLLGAVCLLNIVHKESSGQVYANISSISPIPKGMEKPSAPRNALVYFALNDEDFDRETLKELPENLRAKIEGSPECVRLSSGQPLEPETEMRTDADLDDAEIPF